MTHVRKLSAIFGLVALVALAATPALAGFRDVFITSGTLLNGQEIPQGQYQVSWKKNGTDDQITFLVHKGTRIIATANGKFVEREEKAANDSLIYKPNGNGTKEIIEVRFARKSRAIVLES